MNRAQVATGMAGVFFLSALCGFGQQPGTSSTARTVPRVVKFTGMLSDVAGKPLSGPADVTFSLYKEQSGGEPLWWETQTLEADAQGRYTVLLGATRPEGLPVEVFASGEARWLAVQVGKEPEQARVLLVSVPYALKAEEAEMLGGKRASEFVLAEKLKEEVKTAVAVEVQQVGEKSSEQVASEKGPQPLTGAEGPTDFTGSNSTQIVSVTQTGTGKAVYALIQNAASGAQAVRGETNGTSGTAVFGYATATTGTAVGVRGQSDSPNGLGVSAYVSAATGYNYAVWGLTRSPQGRGVLAQASATSGPTVGVLGMVSSPSGVAGRFRNTTVGGKVLVGEVGASAPYTQVFSVDGSGNVVAAGGMTATGIVAGAAGIFSGSNLQILTVTQTGGIGTALLATGGAYGVNGSADYAGVYGEGNTYGVYGSGLVSGSYGVYGSGDYGVYGSGSTRGVYGTGSNYGVYGSGSISGVYGYNPAYGSYGHLGTSVSGRATGVRGDASGSLSSGVRGTSDLGAGVRGISASGPGVVSYSDTATLYEGYNASGVKFYVTNGGGVFALSYSVISDHNAKDRFASVDGTALLARLNAMPILTWNYKAEDASIRHMGPMAQDFHAAFGLGEDDKHITTVDESGVALAAIQALYRMTQAKDDKIETLTNEVDELRTRLARLEQALAKRSAGL